MTTVLYILLLIVCFVVLIKGADFLVDGASSIAARLGVPTLVIGLTIVAFGTSCPEAGVSIVSSIDGANQLSYANVVGSNIFNLLVVLGFSACLSAVPVSRDILFFDYPICIACSALLVFFGMDKYISRAEGIIFLALIVLYCVYLIIRTKKNPEAEEEPIQEQKNQKLWVSFLKVILSIAAISLSAKGIVLSCTHIATILGISDTIIGLTVVAIGTSLPELATSIVAHKKGENAIAVGNVVGSNIFNILFVLGAAGAISPLEITRDNIVDGIFCLAVTALCYIFVLTKKRVSRGEGISMMLIYVAYTVYACLREFDMVSF